MTPILLTTLNARYSHCAFGLRYLFANLKEYQEKSKIVEFTISQNPSDIAETLLSENPELIGFSVYIWNTRQTQEVVSILKRIRPEIKIVLGGPEVSYETESQEICKLADLTIRGEADFLFYELCREFFQASKWPSSKWISGGLPDVAQIALPYVYYSDSDIRNRVIYVEASRGCPYKCEYCLSSLDKSVRSFDLSLFLEEMDRLIERGARQFKFIDRTFNLNIATSSRILGFFLERISKGLFLHFEMVPDRLPVELRELISLFPKGSLQFEIGIQTWNPEVGKLVSRRQDYKKIAENFMFLSEKRNVHTHADLIAGLPGETLESFAAGFDALAKLKPDEIQVGILKRLKGTPIIRHDQEWEMRYQEHPPFQVLQTKTMSFEVLQKIGRFSHYWDAVANSGHFKRTFQLITELAEKRSDASGGGSLFLEFDELSAMLSRRHPQRHGVALMNLMESVWIYLTEHRGLNEEVVREALLSDYNSDIQRSIPSFLRVNPRSEAVSPLRKSATPSRQRRHAVT
jgi:radical SAM superfamily enzyme YgiQ (UPF0313 family)